MEKIELKHIVDYLPYDLEFKDPETVCPGTMVAIVAGMPGLIFYEDKDDINYFDLHRIKPLLVPLSELKNTNAYEDISKACEQRMVEEYYHLRLEKNYSPLGMPYWVFTILVEYHFDVFGLIDAGLALNKLDYGTVKTD